MRAQMRTAGGRRGESGQVLVLFVALFTVLLAMGAFAIDQGLAYGKHGVAQNNADTASRAGARQCLVSLSGGTSASNACGNSAEAAAEANATANLADGTDVTPAGGADCQDTGVSNFPAMSVEVDRPSPALFSLFFGAGDFTARARATACIGEVSGLVQSNDIDGVPMWFTQPSCGGGTSAGRMCNIYSSGSGVSWSGFFTRFFSSGSTCGPSSSGLVATRLQNGMTASEYPCAAGDALRNVSVSPGPVLNAFEGRLPASGEPCVSGWSRTDTSRAVQAVLTTVAGDAARPAGAGGGDLSSTVYQQQDCNSERLVLVPLVSGSGSTKTIRGFAGVYLVGCGRDDAGAPSRLNDCDTDFRGYRDGGPCRIRDHRGNCTDDSRTRVWGIVVRMYLPGDNVQDLQGIVTTGSTGWVGSVGALGLQTTR